ncbi:hypothetical protein C8Q77DRAFT_1045159 [Trametes polyzona]|nr:hypothetical protein C8Q77DRAFT_1045159 [Trametes polyzona]
MPRNGAGPVYPRRELRMRGGLRASMRHTLVSLSGDKRACMHWTVRAYFRKIYVEYGLELVGWPPDLPFADLSDPGLTGFVPISRLIMLWETGELRFVRAALDRAERERRDPMDVAPCKINDGLPPNLGRSDIKKRRERKKVDAVRFPQRYVRNGPKSAEWVTDEAEARAEQDEYRGEDPDDPIEEFTDSE